MSTVGRKLLSSFVHTGDLQEYIRLPVEEHLFKETEIPLYHAIRNHVTKYGKIPSQSTLEAMPGLDDAIVDAPEPPKFYFDETQKRFMHSALKATVQEVSSLLVDKAPEAAMDVLLRYTSALFKQSRRASLFDFRDVETVIHDAYMAQKLMGSEITLPYGWPTLDEMSGGMRAGDFVTFVGRPMAGKAQPLTSKVLTPTGWTTMGELKVGDALASVDGKPSQVLEVFPQGVKQVYRLTFQDGRTADASDEHLWEVWYRDWDEPRVMTTMQLIAKLENKRYQKRLTVRLFSGDYGAEYSLPFSPYLLGAMIGDGCFRGPAPMFSSEDQDLISRMNLELKTKGLEAVWTDRCNYRITGTENKPNSLKEWLTDLGLWGKKSEEKFIPAWLLRCSREIRRDLLQGLMDTDGTAGTNGSVSYCSSSPKLARQVQELVWSLGGRARVSLKPTTHQDSYIVHIVFQDRSVLFGLQRKQARVSEVRIRKVNTRLRIESVERIADQECQCITVSHPDHLYITDNYVVTHNTFKLLYTSLNAWHIGRTPLFVSMEMMALIIQQRLTAMQTHKKLTDLLKAELSTQAYKDMMLQLKALKAIPNPFWVLDSNLASNVDDILQYVMLLNPSCLFVDGGYLLEHPDKKMGKWDKQAENARLLKQVVATDMGIPVAVSYQLSKQSAKSKKKGKGEADGMEDVYGSDEMAQLSTVMLGLYDNEANVEAKTKRTVKILKGRNGETGQFDINWDFSSKMDFSEIVPEDPHTMQMGFLG